MTQRRCLSVAVPCFNEAGTVAALVDRVLASPWVAEVVVVDDGSTDGTAKVLADVDDPRVRVMTHATNRGKGAALRTAFATVGSDYVIVQDADLEYDPADYDVMLEPLERGVADVVFGSRFLSGRPHRVLYFWHSLGNRTLTLLSNMFTDLNLTDMETCYKCFRREVLRTFTLREDRFGVEPELTARVAGGGWRVYEVGISYDGRTYEEGKKIGWRDGVRALWCVVKYSPVVERRLKRRDGGPGSRARDSAEVATDSLRQRQGYHRLHDSIRGRSAQDSAGRRLGVRSSAPRPQR